MSSKHTENRSAARQAASLTSAPGSHDDVTHGSAVSAVLARFAREGGTNLEEVLQSAAIDGALAREIQESNIWPERPEALVPEEVEA